MGMKRDWSFQILNGYEERVRIQWSTSWCLQQTVLNWWRWCLHRQNGRRSLHTWRSFCDVRNSFSTLLSSIYQGRKILWQTSWHEVLELRHLLWFMLTQFLRGGSRIRNLLSFLAFCRKKKKYIYNIIL